MAFPAPAHHRRCGDSAVSPVGTLFSFVSIRPGLKLVPSMYCKTKIKKDKDRKIGQTKIRAFGILHLHHPPISQMKKCMFAMLCKNSSLCKHSLMLKRCIDNRIK